MKMVKSLLLGSAAGLVAIAGAQAADLPVKAKPVEYVKVCSLYGAGFYYMPGTDICLKLGGYVRFQVYENNGTAPSNGLFHGTSGFQTRLFGQANDLVYRTRAILTLDTRQQTEYGTLRTYTLMGYTHDGPSAASTNAGGTSASLYATRGFIQLAGFTVGKAQSFYDIFSGPAVSYFGLASSDTGDSGVILAAYTAQFGNGFTGTISLEDPRKFPVVNGSLAAGTSAGVAAGGTSFQLTSTNPFIIGGPTAENGNVRWPDVVGVLRVDQAWGSAQVMAAAHDASAGYYGTTITGSQVFGHPDDKLGWAVGVGAILNADAISRGDKFQFQVNYTEGALRYLDFTPATPGSPFLFGSGNSLGLGWYTDGIYSGTNAANGTSVQLTKGFGANASYDHVWNERWKTSVYGGYIQVRYNDDAKAIIATATCGAVPGGNTAVGASLRSIQNCDPDWSQWFVGSRTQFNINSSTYMGLDVIYRRLNTAFAGTATYQQLAGTARPSGAYAIEDQDAVTVTFRVHRDFLP